MNVGAIIAPTKWDYFEGDPCVTAAIRNDRDDLAKLVGPMVDQLYVITDYVKADEFKYTHYGWASMNLKAEDKLYLFFINHGMKTGDGRYQEESLCFSDEPLPDRDFYWCITNLKCDVFPFIIACFSGGQVLGPETINHSPIVTPEMHTLARSQWRGNVVSFLSSGRYEFSWVQNWRKSVYAMALEAALFEKKLPNNIIEAYNLQVTILDQYYWLCSEDIESWVCERETPIFNALIRR